MRGGRVKDWQGFPVSRVADDMLCVFARALGLPSPFILHTPVFCTKRGGWCYLDQVKIIRALEMQGCFGKQFWILVVNREMTPEGDRRPVKAFMVETSLDPFFMGVDLYIHWICLISQNIALPRPICKTGEASLKSLRSSFV